MLLLIINKKVAYAHSIDTTIDDLGWLWTARSSNFLGMSRDFAKRMNPYCQRQNIVSH